MKMPIPNGCSDHPYHIVRLPTGEWQCSIDIPAYEGAWYEGSTKPSCILRCIQDTPSKAVSELITFLNRPMNADVRNRVMTVIQEFAAKRNKESQVRIQGTLNIAEALRFTDISGLHFS